MQSLRLDDLIRKGSKDTKQIAGAYLRTTINEFGSYTSACAIGAAEHALTGAEVVYKAKDLNSVLRKMLNETEIPFHHTPTEADIGKTATMSLAEVIMALNDRCSYTREEIADWVETLIDEKGYDLTITVTDETDEICEERDAEPNPERTVAA